MQVPPAQVSEIEGFNPASKRVYALLSGSPQLFSSKVKVAIDFGQSTSWLGAMNESMIVDGNGKEIKFNSMIDAMNYLGRVLSDGFSGNFLKEALRAADMKMPYRGPELYQSGEFTYRCKVTGDFTWFQGYEEIYKEDTKVYECVFHGGLVR